MEQGGGVIKIGTLWLLLLWLQTDSSRASAWACPGRTPAESIQQRSAPFQSDASIPCASCAVPPTPPSVTRAGGAVAFSSFYGFGEQGGTVDSEALSLLPGAQPVLASSWSWMHSPPVWPTVTEEVRTSARLICEARLFSSGSSFLRSCGSHVRPGH